MEEANDGSNNRDDSEELDDRPTNTEAEVMLSKCLLWLEGQPEADSIQLLMLKRLRDLAARKRMSKLRQPKLTSFFS